MKKATTILAISSLLSFGISFLAIASPPVTTMQLSQRVSCKDAIASVKQKIQENRDIPLRFEARDIANYGWQEGAPPRGQKVLEVTMGGVGMKGNRQDMLNVMNSSQFLRTLSSKVINACNDVSGVNIGIGNTDYSQFYGLVGDRVQPFKCVASDRTSRRSLAWGYTICL